MRHGLTGLALAAALAAAGAAAETQTEIVNEARLNLFFAVPAAEAQALLPAGWEVAPPPAGPVAGATVLLSLVDRTLAADPEGEPLDPAAFRLAVIAVFGRNPATGEAGPVVVNGWADAAGAAPGAYGAFVEGDVARATRSDGPPDAPASVEDAWTITGPGGDRATIRVAYAAAPPAFQRFDMKVFSAPKPGFHRVYRGDNGVLVVKSAPMGVDRTTALEVAAEGPALGALFDADAPLVGVIAVPWYRRATFLP